MRYMEDPNLREVEHGLSDVDEQYPLTDIHHSFFYRFDNGESPADCYTRVDSFMASMKRQCVRKKKRTAVIVTHGLTIRCFVKRYLHLSVEQFDRIKNLWNCDVITIGPRSQVPEAQLVKGRNAVSGLRLRT